MNPADRPRTLQLRQTGDSIEHQFTNGIGEKVSMRWRRVHGGRRGEFRRHGGAWLTTRNGRMISVQQHRGCQWRVHTERGVHQFAEQPASRNDALLWAGLLLDHMAAIGDKN